MPEHEDKEIHIGGAMWTITELTSEPDTPQREAFLHLLHDSVEGGASVGFLPPLSRAEAEEYWSGVFADVIGQRRVLLAAWDGTNLVGSVQLELAMKPNGRHRGEVQKLLVLRAWRGRGIGAALMLAVEDAARKRGRSLLVLDTRQGDTAERLYQRLGYSRAGVIPRFARNMHDTLDATVIFYKELGSASA
jgi:acetyltransferase